MAALTFENAFSKVKYIKAKRGTFAINFDDSETFRPPHCSCVLGNVVLNYYISNLVSKKSVEICFLLQVPTYHASCCLKY